jgi:anti-sigma regulatory factor (Ser/Thr protein kinase)
MTIHFQMGSDVRLVASTRAIVASALASTPGPIVDVAVLLTDELATNAFVHGGGEYTVALDLDEVRLRVEVTDRCPDLPIVYEPSIDREYGRGMAMVNALATAWGAEQIANGKTVWFELRRDGF